MTGFVTKRTDMPSMLALAISIFGASPAGAAFPAKSRLGSASPNSSHSMSVSVGAGRFTRTAYSGGPDISALGNGVTVILTEGIRRGPSRRMGVRSVDVNSDCRRTEGDRSRRETPFGVRGRLRERRETSMLSSVRPRGGGDGDCLMGRSATRAPSVPHFTDPPLWRTVLRVCALRTSPVELYTSSVASLTSFWMVQEMCSLSAHSTRKRGTTSTSGSVSSTLR